MEWKVPFKFKFKAAFNVLIWSSLDIFATRLALAQPLLISNEDTQSDEATVEDQAEHVTRKINSRSF
jgi:hypothetical protein